MLALVNLPSPNLEDGLRSGAERPPIDGERALRQHQAYREALRDCGAEVRLLELNRAEPDGVFLEDTAIVLDEVAVLASMGTETRRRELPAVEPVLREYRAVRRVQPPAKIEGGDVLRVGRILLVGLSRRTDAAGTAALAELVRPHGYTVRPVPLRGCLHLKSAVTALPDGRLLANPAWLDPAALAGFELVPVPEGEPWGANAALLGEWVLLAAAYPRTLQQVRDLGFPVRAVDLSEFAKADGAVTCLSLVFRR